MGVIRRLLERQRRRSAPADEIEPGSLRDALVGLLRHFDRKHIDCALVGGLALAARGVVRGTRDLDFLVDEKNAAAVHEVMVQLGFETLSRGESISSYLLDALRVDFLIAKRAYGRGMLERAELVPVAPTTAARVVQVEDLICLKLQALVENPARGRDRTDIEALLRTHGSAIKMEIVREYAAALGATRELDDMLATLATRTR